MELNMLKLININFDWDIFLNANYNVPDYSCATHQKSDNPNLYEKYGQHPDTYNMYNTVIHQIWWDDKVLKKQLGDLLGIDVVSVSAIEQPCGQIITLHQDFFYKIKEQFPDDTRTKVRANIFLEDWKFGHILQYEADDEWHCPTRWKQGEGFMWDDKVVHLSANAGFQSKYTLQVSGFLK